MWQKKFYHLSLLNLRCQSTNANVKQKQRVKQDIKQILIKKEKKENMSSSLIPSLMAGNNIKNYERGSKLHQVKATTNSIHVPFNNNKNQNSMCTNGKNANELKGQHNINSKIFHDFLY